MIQEKLDIICNELVNQLTDESLKECKNELIAKCLMVLQRKGQVYSSSEDRLLNFKEGAKFRKSTPLNVLWGFLLKHLICIQTNIDKNETKIALYIPKIIDSINYLILLYAILKEQSNLDGKEM